MKREHLEFYYVNTRGECALRKVIPLKLFYGTQHPIYKEPQWLLECFDLDKNEYRTFMLSKVQGKSFNLQFTIADTISHIRWAIQELPKIYDSIVGKKNFLTFMRNLRSYKTKLSTQLSILPEQEYW